ncbi:uncharacterized protein LOC125314568 [Rhodamnia argentea]|uniref:Uncharacterized protein LOC125314568 n=1 Tax=Rhodamnia argentea TaxID=178133 RepID=A0ABM3H8Y5_9MYRT|nr:uncharacterized protein LOC125314568 [Rhodamnia argentea]
MEARADDEAQNRNLGAAAFAEIQDLRAMLIRLSTEVRALSVQRNRNQVRLPPPVEMPGLVDDLPANPVVEDAVTQVLAPAPLDPISAAISARLEEETKKRFADPEQQLKDKHGLENVGDLSRYDKIDFPDKFKVPYFTKYFGKGDPRAHLVYYTNRMGRYVKNVPLLIQTFRNSLEDAALIWFLDMKPDKVTRWEDLAKAFVEQYQYNTEMAPTREVLSRTIKKRDESFRVFAHRWRALAAEVRPPLEEPEMISMFVKTLPNEFYQKLIGAGFQNFPLLVEAGERIEGGMHEGRIAEGASRRAPIRKEKEVEISFVQAPVTRSTPTSQLAPNRMASASGSYRNSGYQNTQLGKPRQFTPLPRPLSQLLPALLGKQLVTKEVARANPPKYRGFDLSKSCAFHTGERGHDVDGCYVLKHKVQDLLEGNRLSFKDFEPNVQRNPLPCHAPNVAIIEEVRSVTKKRFE